MKAVPWFKIVFLTFMNQCKRPFQYVDKLLSIVGGKAVRFSNRLCSFLVVGKKNHQHGLE